MKPAAFEYAQPRTVDEAVRLLGGTPGAKILAGGQTLGPMLNLRLAQPPMLIDITRIPELAAVSEDSAAVTIGATVTHAAIEDGRVPDPARGFLRRVAAGIAYRAVRNRGTVGGSLAHADPAADWLAALTALGASLAVAGPRGTRRIELAQFVVGAMESDLAADEIVTGIRVAKFSERARFGFHKICRKTGEFAEAIGVVVDDPQSGRHRVVAGATGGRPLVIDQSSGPGPISLAAGAAEAALRAAGFAGDDHHLTLQAAALRRACAEALAA